MFSLEKGQQFHVFIRRNSKKPICCQKFFLWQRHLLLATNKKTETETKTNKKIKAKLKCELLSCGRVLLSSNVNSRVSRGLTDKIFAVLMADRKCNTRIKSAQLKKKNWNEWRRFLKCFKKEKPFNSSCTVIICKWIQKRTALKCLKCLNIKLRRLCSNAGNVIKMFLINFV